MNTSTMMTLFLWYMSTLILATALWGVSAKPFMFASIVFMNYCLLDEDEEGE